MKQNDIKIRREYMQNNSKRMELRFWKEKDDDIMAFLDSKEKRERTSVIREAIRLLMAKEGFEYVCDKENGGKE